MESQNETQRIGTVIVAKSGRLGREGKRERERETQCESGDRDSIAERFERCRQKEENERFC